CSKSKPVRPYDPMVCAALWQDRCWSSPTAPPQPRPHCAAEVPPIRPLRLPRSFAKTVFVRGLARWLPLIYRTVDLSFCTPARGLDLLTPVPRSRCLSETSSLPPSGSGPGGIHEAVVLSDRIAMSLCKVQSVHPPQTSRNVFASSAIPLRSWA